MNCTDIARDWLADLFCRHYHRERSYQDLGIEITHPGFRSNGKAEVRCRARLGGLLRYYHREAA